MRVNQGNKKAFLPVNTQLNHNKIKEQYNTSHILIAAQLHVLHNGVSLIAL